MKKRRGSRGGSKGAKKPSLHSLGRGELTPDELELFYQELERSADRNLALITTSSLHHAIANGVIRKLGTTSESMIELLYDRDGPLSSLYSASITALALGVIDEEAFENTNILRRIRNAFAHSARPLTFGTALIYKECEKLTIRTSPHLTAKPKMGASLFLFVANAIELQLMAERNRLLKRKRRNLLAKLRRDERKRT